MDHSKNTLLMQYDELVRCFDVLVDNTNLEKVVLRFFAMLEDARQKWVEATDECKRLKLKLDATNKDITVLDKKLFSARQWLDAERQLRKRLETERDMHCRQLNEVRHILFNDPCYKLSEEAKEKLAFLSKATNDRSDVWRPAGLDRLNTIAESDSMSNLSDVSISRSGDDLDDIPPSRAGTKHRQSFLDDEPATTAKKRRSSGLLTPFVPTAPSVESIEFQPYQDADGKYDDQKNMVKLSAMHRINTRTHVFVSKTFIMPETCSTCGKKIGFGRMVYKCVECNAVAHPECFDKVALPCIPMGVSPKKPGAGVISDYAPSSPPMVPAIVIHSVNEVERRGLKEIGIYRMSGTDSVVRGLREKFVKGKGVPCLSDVDIHSVCCFLKDFLRNLQDPLIPRAKWMAFSEAIGNDRPDEKLCDLVSTLPQANRDTLAYLMLHLKNVAASPECKMSVSNLATVFGPTIVGYSNADQLSPLTQALTTNTIMEKLLSLPADYWNHFINSSSSEPPKTPYNNYTPRTQTGFFTGKTSNRKVDTNSSCKRKFFTSPPLQ